jgi:membrane-associated protease RseP (regulator of RpoE activity)
MSLDLYILLFIFFGFWMMLNVLSSPLKERGIEVTAFTLLWRTKRLIRLIDNLAKTLGKFWDYFAKIGIFASLCGIVFVFYILIDYISKAIESPEPMPGATLVIPGVTIPLWYGLIGLVTLIIVHEFAHGIIARRENIPLKSVGAGVFIALPLAFVEPEEEEIKKASPWSRIKVYAAGSTANFLTGAVAFLLLMLLGSMMSGVEEGIEIYSIQEGMPAEGVLEEGMVISGINEIEFQTQKEFSEIMDQFSPGDTIVLRTDRGPREITLTENPDDPAKGYIGITLISHLTRYGTFLLPIYFSIYWIYLLNIGIGLMNLLPIAPLLDGGKIVKELLDMKFPKSVSTTIAAFLAVISVSLLILNFFPGLIEMIL